MVQNNKYLSAHNFWVRNPEMYGVAIKLLARAGVISIGSQDSAHLQTVAGSPLPYHTRSLCRLSTLQHGR